MKTLIKIAMVLMIAVTLTSCGASYMAIESRPNSRYYDRPPYYERGNMWRDGRYYRGGHYYRYRPGYWHPRGGYYRYR